MTSTDVIIPSELQCPISLDLMTSPVKLLQSGQVYDSVHFTQWIKEGGKTDPMTNLPLQCPVVLRPLPSLREKIEKFALENGIELGPAAYGVTRFVSNQSGSRKQAEAPQHGSQSQIKLVQIAKKFVHFLMSPSPIAAGMRPAVDS